MKQKKGFGLVIVIFIMLVFSVLALGFVALLFSETRLAAEEYRYSRAFYLAEAGRNYALEYLSDYSDWSADLGLPLSRQFGQGCFTLNSSSESADQLDIYATGLITVEGKSYVRQLKVTVNSTGGFRLPHNFDYALYAADSTWTPTLWIWGPTEIHGDFYYDGPVILLGDVELSDGTLYCTKVTTYGGGTYENWETVPEVDMPTWDNSTYAGILAETENDTYAFLHLTAGQTLNLAGRTLYYKQAYIDIGSTVNGPGTIVATGQPSGTGNIVVNDGAAIGQGVRFIAQTTFGLQGSNNIAYPIEVYAKGHISILNGLGIAGNSVLYSSRTDDLAIYILGDVNGQLLAPNGEVRCLYGHVNGLVYADLANLPLSGEFRGSVVANETRNIGGVSDIYFDASYLPDYVAGFDTGGGAERQISISNWREIY
ncbi:MAG: pilus assembly PilX N-terminal domain-containing protein [bacterium]